MRVKAIVLIVLGMSFSFAVILGILGVFSSASMNRRARPTAAVLETRPIQTRQSITSASASAQQAFADLQLESAPVSPEPFPEIVDAHLPSQSTIGRIESLERSLASPSKHLNDVHADLQRQIASLKKNRDLMLDDLAAELRQMTPERAADEVRILDKESAKLALSRLTKVQRKAILRALDATRAGMLDRNQRTLAAK